MTRTKPNGAESDKPRDLAELLPSLDPLVIQRRAEENQLVPQLDAAKSELDLYLHQQTNADAHLRSQRLLRAQGRPADVDRAEADRDRWTVRIKDQRRLITDLESTLFDAHLATTEAQKEAVKRAFAAGIAEGSANVTERNQHHEALLPHVARSREIHRFLETVSAEAKRLEVTGCVLTPQASLVLSGGCPATNAASWLTDLFVPDLNAPRGGGLGLWRHAAILAGLLEPTASSKAEHEREKRRKADDMVRSALAEGWVRQHLSTVWADTDLRNLGGK